MKGIQTTLLVTTLFLSKEVLSLNHVASNGDNEVMSSDSSWSSSSHSKFHHFNSGSSNSEAAEASNRNENKSLETILKGIKELRPDIDIFVPNAFDSNNKIKVNGWHELQGWQNKANVKDINPTGTASSLDNFGKVFNNLDVINPSVIKDNLPNTRQDNSDTLVAKLLPITTIDNLPLRNQNPTSTSINSISLDSNSVLTATTSINHWFEKITSSLNSNYKHQHPTDVTDSNSSYEVVPTSTFTVTASSYLEESTSVSWHSAKSQSSSKNFTSSESSSFVPINTEISWYIYLPLTIYLINRV